MLVAVILFNLIKNNRIIITKIGNQAALIVLSDFFIPSVLNAMIESVNAILSL